MTYQINILRRAQKQLGSLQKNIYERSKRAILQLADEPKPQGCFERSFW